MKKATVSGTAGHPEDSLAARPALPAMTLAAIGVVFGDIGTSPLYALKEIFSGHHPIPVTPENILGMLSMVFWSIMLLVSIKYLTIIMRADNHGEGGSLALLALVTERARNPRMAWAITLVGIFAAALFYGDSMITPAISVLSAVEGLEIVTTQFKPYVVPITLIIITGLFFIQKRGTGTVGLLFGPVMLVWFGILGLLGVLAISHNPGVLMALRKAGVRVPEDVSVSGFDDLSYARVFVPSLTTVRSPVEAAGLAAARPFVPMTKLNRANRMFGGEQERMYEIGAFDICDEDLPDVGFSWPRYILSWPGILHTLIAHRPSRGETFKAEVRRCRP